MKKILLFTLLFPCLKLVAQTIVKFDTTKTAQINVSLVNAAKKELSNEEILLFSPDKKTIYNLITNNNGKVNIVVKTGINYSIVLKTLADSFYYGTIDVPAITAKQNYTTPFLLDMIFEPSKYYTFHNLEFDVNKALIKPNSYQELNMLVEYLKRKVKIHIKVGGHTDSDGNDNANLILSKKRAESVKNYLINKGIQSNRISTQGFGETMPKATNDTEEGKQKNRRTEVEFI